MTQNLPGKITCIGAALIAIVVSATTVSSDDATPIPANRAQVEAWFNNNIKPLPNRKGLNDTLLAAESGAKIVKVRKDGSGQFKTVTDAVNSVPANNKQRVIIDIGPGTYREKVTVERNKPFVTFYGAPGKVPTLSFDGTAAKYGTVYSATLQVDAPFFTAANLIIENTAPKPDGKTKGAQALAMRIGGDMATFYNVRLLGFQDTLCDDKGRHFFKDCYIEGTVDFIFGSGKSIYLNTELYAKADEGMTVIAAHARSSQAEDTGFSFVHCKVTGKGTGAMLGRPWTEMPKVVFAYTTMSEVVDPKGWSSNNHPEREGKVYFAEYKSSGAGGGAPNTRAKFTKHLSDEEVKKFITLGFIEGSKWVLPPPKV
ncbi:hypothetical protein K2173_005570 [Erythroxylum novogranatense]|uniref:Pectinesterase n=1 Tax=Erythroxylum novogranatense TaxID=1862640 RepID=A0AAV8SK86_9ROSI|nr:hypothetical protein K2173_005570 [Erythroxylum novogranatense]